MGLARTRVYFIVCCLAFVALFPPLIRGDAPYPIVTVGNFWKYDMQSTIVGETSTISLSGTLSLEIVAEEDVSLKGTDYETYRMKTTGSGNAGIPGVSGTWTISGSDYLRRSDFASVKSSLTTQFSLTGPGGTASFTEVQEITNEPPASSYNFPLSIGKSWIASLSQTTNLTTWSSLDPTPVSNSTTVLLSRTYNVLRSEKATTSAGSFEVYVVRSSDAKATIEDYYSPNVGNTVKGAVTYPDGSTLNLLLREYKAWTHRGNLLISSQGQQYAVDVKTNVEFANLRQNSTSMSFEVDGLSGVSGKATVEIPVQLNSTSLKVYLDSRLVIAAVSRNSTHYHVSVTFTMSSHTISIVFAEKATSFTSPLTNPPIIAAIAIALIVGIVLVLALLMFRRRKPTQPVVSGETPSLPGPGQPQGEQPSGTPSPA